jgi:hypothetical protein
MVNGDTLCRMSDFIFASVRGDEEAMESQFIPQFFSVYRIYTICNWMGIMDDEN